MREEDVGWGDRWYLTAFHNDDEDKEYHNADPYKLGLVAALLGPTGGGRRSYRVSKEHSRRSFGKNAICLLRNRRYTGDFGEDTIELNLVDIQGSTN